MEIRVGKCYEAVAKIHQSVDIRIASVRDIEHQSMFGKETFTLAYCFGTSTCGAIYHLIIYRHMPMHAPYIHRTQKKLCPEKKLNVKH